MQQQQKVSKTSKFQFQTLCAVLSKFECNVVGYRMVLVLVFIFNVASLRKSERRISSRGHGCLTISPPQLPAAATRFPSHGAGRPGLELRTATKLSSAGFEPTAVLTFGLRVRRLNHSATRSLRYILHFTFTLHFKFFFI